MNICEDKTTHDALSCKVCYAKHLGIDINSIDEWEEEATTYKVDFIGDYFTMSIFVEADDDDVAVELASSLMKSQYGWDVPAVSTVDILVEAV